MINTITHLETLSYCMATRYNRKSPDSRLLSASWKSVAGRSAYLFILDSQLGVLKNPI